MFSHNGYWRLGKVEIALDEMIKCVYDNRDRPPKKLIHQWIEVESDKIAPKDSITNNDREHLFRFFMEIYSAVNQ